MSEPIRDEELSRLYREIPAAEPPPALDAAILAAAHREVAVRPARRAGWRRWMAPAGLLATLVLTVSLTLLVRQEQALRDEALPAAPQAPAGAPAPRQDVAPPAASSVVPPVPPPAPPRAAPRVREAERRAPATATEPPREGPALPAAPQPSAESKSLQAAPAAADAVGVRAKREALHKEAAPGAARTPELWLEEIRRLRRAGREAEAAAALAEFRKAYPDYRLPDDLR